MSDKDQFTFDDDDGFPETDLSAAFSDGEHEAETPVPEVREEPEPEKKDIGSKKAKKPKKEKKPKADNGSSSRTRILLVVLLMIVAGAAGAYYFMDLGGSTPIVPMSQVATTAKKSIALPPKPAKVTKPVPVKTATAKPADTAKVTVAPPPKPTAKKVQPAASTKAASQQKPSTAQPKTVAKAAATSPSGKKQVTPLSVQKKPAAGGTVSVPLPAPAQPDKQVNAAEEAAEKQIKQAKAAAAKQVAAAKKATAAKQTTIAKAKPPTTEKAPALIKPVSVPKSSVQGSFSLDAGSYLLEANRDALIAKIKKLGYDPIVTPVDATLDMTRLRLGTFSKTEVQEALAYARKIEPGSYSAPAGDNYVIYAGTFLTKGNVDKLTKQLKSEGIKVYPEPVQVVRTLSRIRFGSFVDKSDAAKAAEIVGKSGVKAKVVKAK